MDKEINKVADIEKGGLYLYIGNSFWIRSRDNTEIVHLVTITEISLNSEGSVVSIGLGTSTFSSEELLKHYEWSSKAPKDNEWRPFPGYYF